jgi:hypothetical protein
MVLLDGGQLMLVLYLKIQLLDVGDGTEQVNYEFEILQIDYLQHK